MMSVKGSLFFSGKVMSISINLTDKGRQIIKKAVFFFQKIFFKVIQKFCYPKFLLAQYFVIQNFVIEKIRSKICDIAIQKTYRHVGKFIVFDNFGVYALLGQIFVTLLSSFKAT
jgi:hypothetical protein